MFSYAPLMSTMHKQKISKTVLQKELGISSATMAKLSKDEYVSMKVLDEICTYLECDIQDVIYHMKDQVTYPESPSPAEPVQGYFTNIKKKK